MQTREIIKKVKKIEILTGKLVAETFAGQYHSVFKGEGMEFEEVRQYIQGDDISDIDWNVSARLNDIFVKKFVEERELTVMIVCDVSASKDFGSMGKLKSDIATELSALFAFSALKNSDKVGLLLFSDIVELYIPARKGQKHILRIIRELIAFNPKSKKTNIAMCLDNINRIFKKRGIVVFISDFLDSNYERQIKHCSSKHDLIPVVLSDTLEKKVPNKNIILNTIDPETGDKYNLKLSSKKMNDTIATFGDSHTRYLNNLFASLGVDYISLSTQSDMTKEVIQFFKKRAKKIRR